MIGKDQTLDNLWLARAMYELGAVSFGDFTLGGSTINSPVFINPKVVISNPTALRVAAKLMYQEITLAQSLRRSRVQPYDVVAGIPVGGLLLATAYSLESGMPLIYPREKPQGTGQPGVEGRYGEGTRALLIDDLIGGGTSILDTARFMKQYGIQVSDAVVLVDRDQGAHYRLKKAGINLISILKLDVMMNLYRSSALIDEEQHERYLAYVKATQARINPEAQYQVMERETSDSDESPGEAQTEA
ncbi:MAG: orotate phosphoribosyltransferase [Ktedonobacterales bacterium]